jgi:hypothetical protein
MKVRGIKRGQNIELLEQINDIPDGTEIIIDLKIFLDRNIQNKQLLTDEERKKSIKNVILIEVEKYICLITS